MVHTDAMRSLLSRASLVAVLSVSTAIALVQRPETPTEIPKGTNTLYGRILDSRTDAPVAGATVTVTGFFDSSGRAVPTTPASLVGPGASVPRSVMTNGDGFFFFRELPAGRYAIAAVTFGYINSSYPVRIAEVANSERPTTLTVRLSKYAAVSGTVSDEQGEPVAGVPVTVLRRLTLAGQAKLQSAATEVFTDDRGMYRIAQLSPGRYIVGVLSATTTLASSFATELDASTQDQATASALRQELLPGGDIRIASGEGHRVGDFVLQGSRPVPAAATDGRILSYPTTFAPGTPTVTDATVITVESGEQRTAVDISLTPSATARVSGVATGPDGPMKRLAVRLVSPGSADTSSFEPLGVATALTDGNGQFTFLGVTPGQYALEATYVVFGNPNVPNSEKSLWATQAVVVADSDLTGLVVTMKPGIRLSGRFEFKSLSGTPTPIPQNFGVSLRPIGAGVWRSLLGRAGPDGTFVTPGDPAGRYLVLMPSVGGWTLQSIYRDGRPVPDGFIELEGPDISGLVITLTNKPSRVSGSVADARGAADPEADLIIFPADTTLWRQGIFSDRRVRLMHATSGGAFEFSGLPAGEYFIAAVSARLTGDWQDQQFLDRLTTGATRFTLGEGEERTVVLKTIVPRDR